jgi:hypothetical protein
MRKFVLTVALLALCASPSFADNIGLFADMAANQCNITVPLGSVFSVYVVHTSTDGATASEFKVTNPTSATLISTGNDLGNSLFIAIGDPYNGVSVAYTICATGTFVVYNMKFLATAAQPDCVYMSIVPDPGEANGIVKIADCGFIELEATSGQAILNPTASCDCDVPTQETTWGKVKSLYR